MEKSFRAFQNVNLHAICPSPPPLSVCVCCISAVKILTYERATPRYRCALMCNIHMEISLEEYYGSNNPWLTYLHKWWHPARFSSTVTYGPPPPPPSMRAGRGKCIEIVFGRYFTRATESFMKHEITTRRTCEFANFLFLVASASRVIYHRAHFDSGIEIVREKTASDFYRTKN